MPASAFRWTRAMLEALPDDGQRHEIIDGVHYVTPSPGVPHQFVVAELFGELLTYLRAHPVGWAFTGPSDIELAEDTIVQPDIVVVRRTGGRPPKTWRDVGLPILAVEVLSASSASRDRIVKRVRYQRAGIPEYWIVDPVSQVLERWSAAAPHPQIFTDSITWQPEGASRSLTLELHPIFDPVSEEG